MSFGKELGKEIVKAVAKSKSTKELLKKIVENKAVQGTALIVAATAGVTVTVRGANAVIHRIRTSKKVKIGKMEFED